MRIRGYLPALLAIGFCVATVLVPLSRFGMWDPWELTVAEQARAQLAGGGYNSGAGPQVAAHLTELGFAMFGLHDWAGRMPGALAALLALLLTYQLAARHLNRWAGLMAVVVAGANPLFLLNALMIGGQGYGMALQGGVLYCGIRALQSHTPGRISGWAMAMVAVSAMVTLAMGALLGPLPPLLALGAGYLLVKDRELIPQPAGERNSSPQLSVAAGNLILTSAAALTTLVVVTLYRDRAGYSLWTGGLPREVQPAGFDLPIEQIFHGLAPVSALLPIAWVFPFVRSLRDDRMRKDYVPQNAQALWVAIVSALWCAAAYGAQTIFLARFGTGAAFLPIMAVGYLTAYLLYHLHRSKHVLGGTAMCTVLLAGLLLRDFALYPTAPLSVFPDAQLSNELTLDLTPAWAIILAAFALCTALPLSVSGPTGWDPTAPYRLVQTQWRRGWGFRLWLLGLGGGMLSLCVLSLLAWLQADAMHISSYVRLLLCSLGVLCLLAPVLVFAAQLIVVACSRLGRYRFAPSGAAVAGAALFFTYGYLPMAGEHLSPHRPYITFNRLAGEQAQLGTFHFGSAVANYYTHRTVREFSDLHRFTTFLAEGQGHWGVLRLKDFPSVDSRFRTETGHHLFVPNPILGEVVLATSTKVPGLENHNPLMDVVRDTPPGHIQHEVHAVFDGKLELLGYDVAPADGKPFTGGDTVELTWYFRVLKRVYSDYSVFVHIDQERGSQPAAKGATGTRIHGDHAPVSDQLPVYLWRPSDIVVDRHQVQVASSAKPGQYRIWMGFFSGKNRLPVTAGPKDDANRVQAGVLQIR